MKTPVTIVTGFLGSGKSTLLMNLIAKCRDRRIAVVVNEFGEIGIDGNLIQSACGCDEGSVLELKNGCVCCTVQEEFLPTMKKLLNDEEPFDHIIVEASGLALPKPLLKAINWPDLRALLTVDAVITVVDCDGIATGEICDRDRVQRQREADDSVDHETSIEELFEDQLSCADLVVLTKCDLIDDSIRMKVVNSLQSRLRPHIRMVEVQKGNLAPEVALGIAAGAENDLQNRPSHHDDHHHDHDHDDHHHDHDIQSIVWHPGPILDTEEYIREMQMLCQEHEIYRIKGFLDVVGKPMRMVLQGVGSRFESYYDRPWQSEEDRKSHVVLIGKQIEKLENMVAQ